MALDIPNALYFLRMSGFPRVAREQMGPICDVLADSFGEIRPEDFKALLAADIFQRKSGRATELTDRCFPVGIGRSSVANAARFASRGADDVARNLTDLYRDDRASYGPLLDNGTVKPLIAEIRLRSLLDCLGGILNEIPDLPSFAEEPEPAMHDPRCITERNVEARTTFHWTCAGVIDVIVQPNGNGTYQADLYAVHRYQVGGHDLSLQELGDSILGVLSTKVPAFSSTQT